MAKIKENFISIIKTILHPRTQATLLHIFIRNKVSCSRLYFNVLQFFKYIKSSIKNSNFVETYYVKEYALQRHQLAKRKFVLAASCKLTARLKTKRDCSLVEHLSLKFMQQIRQIQTWILFQFLMISTCSPTPSWQDVSRYTYSNFFWATHLNQCL